MKTFDIINALREMQYSLWRTMNADTKTEVDTIIDDVLEQLSTLRRELIQALPTSQSVHTSDNKALANFEEVLTSSVAGIPDTSK